GVPVNAQFSWGTLGLGMFDLNTKSIREAQVLVPSDMVSVGDAYCEARTGLNLGLTRMPGYQQIYDSGQVQRARDSSRKRHTGVFNVLFCGGHVQHMKPSKLFGQTDDVIQRLNNDHQSHKDIIMQDVWPVIND